MHFKSLLTSVAISALLGYMPVANAADMVKHRPHHVKHTAPITQVIIAPSAPAFSWAGPYLGVEIGAIMTKFHATDGSDAVTGGIIKPKEQPAVGLFAGYNFALGRQAIFGIDGNIDYHSVRSPSDDLDTFANRYKEDALAGARIRLGVARGRVLPYIAGGLSVARAGLNVIDENSQDPNKKKTYLGWNIGGGLDYAVAHNMLLRLDYRFSQVKIKDLYQADASGALQSTDANIETKSHEIRVGAAYKF